MCGYLCHGFSVNTCKIHKPNALVLISKPIMLDFNELEQMASIDLLEFRQEIAEELSELDAYIKERAESVTFSSSEGQPTLLPPSPDQP